MGGRTANKLASWSVSAYGFLLQAYPHSLRREFGHSMIQIFRDLVRDAQKHSGMFGLLVLWMRTVWDLGESLMDAYLTAGRQAMFRLVAGAGLLYVCALAVATIYGAVAFGEFYRPPAFSRFGAPAAHEEVLMAAYQQALAGEFGHYRSYVLGAGLVLAVWLGIATALYGAWQRSILHGVGAFLLGSVMTIAAFELLPTIWFPMDRYAVGFAWLLSCFPIAAGAWLLSTLLVRFGTAGALQR